MARARLAERLWTASESDPVLLHALRDSWGGRADVRDALWWHGHPHTATPDGTPDPAAELRSLQAALYSREGGIRGAGDEERLQALVHERDREAQALEDLLDRFEGWTTGAHDEPVDLFRDLASERQEEPRANHTASNASARPPRQAVLLLAAGVVCGVFGTLGVLAVVDTPAATPAPPLSFAAESAAPISVPEDPVNDPVDDGLFQIFSQPPTRLDHPLPFLGTDVLVESIRPIDSFYSFDTYAARNTQNQYCLFVHGTAQGITGGGCSAGTQILAHGTSAGIRLKARDGDPDFPRYVDVTLRWLRDGSFETDVAETDHP